MRRASSRRARSQSRALATLASTTTLRAALECDLLWQDLGTYQKDGGRDEESNCDTRIWVLLTDLQPVAWYRRQIRVHRDLFSGMRTCRPGEEVEVNRSKRAAKRSQLWLATAIAAVALAQAVTQLGELLMRVFSHR